MLPRASPASRLSISLASNVRALDRSSRTNHLNTQSLSLPRGHSNWLKELLEFVDMLNRSWVGTVSRNYDPNGWNGVWPKPGMVKPGMVIYFEPGGVIKEHIERWQELAGSGTDVEILDACYSACTLIVAYVPK